MRKITLLFFLVAWVHCDPASGSGPSFAGAWLEIGVNWIGAPAEINPHLQYGQAQIVYFGRDHVFAVIYCTINRVPKQYMTISAGDPQGVYRGKWKLDGDDIAVEYRLVDRTIEVRGEKLPGPIQRAAIKISSQILTFDRKKFRRSLELDKSSSEVVYGVP